MGEVIGDLPHDVEKTARLLFELRVLLLKGLSEVTALRNDLDRESFQEMNHRICLLDRKLYVVSTWWRCFSL